ncbi:MAG: hypothetical protein N2V78_02930 [Methanophagales archaeon]|nr:hypothetical protein [Methanophagales archaeon]
MKEGNVRCRMQESKGYKIRPVAVIEIAMLLLMAVLTAGIASAESTATRILPAESVSAGECFTVSIDVSDYDSTGYVNETLPEGFLYLGSDTIDPGQVTHFLETNTVKFYLLGESSFTYNVKAPDTEGTYTFDGILVDIHKKEHEVGGDTEIEVEEEEEEAEPTATRTLPEEPVSAGESFNIEIEASHYGYFGHVVETLPEGFTYKMSTLNPESVEVEDNRVEFTLRGGNFFSYTVTAPGTEGTYTFTGILVDEEANEHDISGDFEIVVGEKEGRVTIGAPNITAWKPVETTVENAVGESRTFYISVNQTVNISWQINGSEVQTNESLTEAAYMNASAVFGTWNVSAIATNTTTGLSNMHTWIWSVTSTPVATPTLAVNITPPPTPTPLLTPLPTSKPSPRPTSIPTPTPTPGLPGFEGSTVFAAIFTVAYLLLCRKKEVVKDNIHFSNFSLFCLF